ncbi:MAG: cobyric acid synthase [Cellvibrionaceae bacterium]|nr:cobyric acid synthase [Cellvibrionaceae bacterium]
MVQGATSDAGKSILVTALCRILARHQLSVAPFKPQNMALNSAVTVDGGEIGRAQAVQAQACYLTPSIAMNPVLLKPNSELGAQLIVNGRARGNLQARDYHQYKPELLDTVLAAHRQLQQAHQIVLVEGAGSPAEINLRAHDIANMGFAEAVDCPVIIVADIDRGGVFAHLYGTYALLSASEQQRVQGFVINRFRGDVSLLESGLQWLQARTGVPTLAVIPYLPKLHIEAEDSLAASPSAARADTAAVCNIVVIHYPRTSNPTDFDALRQHPHINCQLQREAAHFRGADLLVLPGSKSVRDDLSWLESSGWAAHIKRHMRLGGKLMGICGGYQMLGKTLADPEGVESPAGISAGLGLLDIHTRLTGEKTLRTVSGHFVAPAPYSGEYQDIPVSGYEIHTGVTTGPGVATPLLSLSETNSAAQTQSQSFMDGAISADDSVIGTYVHGFFDSPQVVDYCLQWLGLTPPAPFDYQAHREAEIERLADAVEKVLPLERLLSLIQVNAVDR